MFEIKQLRFKSILDIPHLIIDRPVSCIVGASGSGKTTLLRMLNRLNLPDSGHILYNGEDIAQMNPVQLRRRVVMLGQTPILYPGDIEDNLQVGLTFSQKKEASQQEMLQALEQVGLHKALDDSCATLSGGEKQRLCLARVLLMDAEVYLMDEPSSALDKETESFVIDNLASLATARGRQLVMVTHSQEIASRYPGSCIRIAQGRTEGYTQ